MKIVLTSGDTAFRAKGKRIMIDTPTQQRAGELKSLLPTFSSCWTKVRNIALPTGLFILSFLGCGTTLSHIGRYGACPESDLILYTARPFATEQGISHRCGLLRAIEDGRETIPDPLRQQVLDELSNRFAVEIVYTGVVDLPGNAIDYLLGNIRETAMLVSTYSDNEYQAIQVDPPQGGKRFIVTNNDTFFAGFTYLYSYISQGNSEHMFFESGHARVLFWRVWGNSIVQYKLYKNDNGTSRYEVKVYVFTESRLLKTILNSRLFLIFSRRMFEDILKDIESATKHFAATPDSNDYLPTDFVADLKIKLQ